jgi:transcriptional regulator with XRE-family HTH domain
MYGSKKQTKKIRNLRKGGGKWLQEQREKAQLSQRDLACALNLPYYTFISQVENGVARIPPEHYEKWATVLNIPIGHFVRAMLMYYDPIIFNLLFPENTSKSLPKNGKSLSPRALRRVNGSHIRATAGS